jgi:hypothetical protein
MIEECSIPAYEDFLRDCRRINVDNEAELEELLEAMNIARRIGRITDDNHNTLCEILSDRM